MSDGSYTLNICENYNNGGYGNTYLPTSVVSDTTVLAESLPDLDVIVESPYLDTDTNYCICLDRTNHPGELDDKMCTERFTITTLDCRYDADTNTIDFFTF